MNASSSTRGTLTRVSLSVEWAWMDKDLPPTAPRLRALREAIGLTQEALAGVVGIARTHVVALETGRLKATRVETRRRLAVGFGVSLELLNEYLDGHAELDVLVKARRRAGRAA